jgi:hypothetical protein
VSYGGATDWPAPALDRFAQDDGSDYARIDPDLFGGA